MFSKILSILLLMSNEAADLPSSSLESKRNQSEATSTVPGLEYFSYRDQTIAFLSLLCSPKHLALCRQKFDSAKLVRALSTVWFEQIFQPSERYVQDLRGDFSQSAADTFSAEFQKEELEALNRFHRFFELRLDLLEQQEIELEDSAHHPTWLNITKDATCALDALIGSDGTQDQLIAAILVHLDSLSHHL